jgi:hypothetical protein
MDEKATKAIDILRRQRAGVITVNHACFEFHRLLEPPPENPIRAKMASGYLLLVNETSALLVKTPWTQDEIFVPHVEALSFIRDDRSYVSFLSQFQWYAKSGWRQLVGDRGEKYDVFALVQ